MLFKRKYTSKRMDIREILEKADKKLFKVRSVDPDCQLSDVIPKKKGTMYQLRNKSAQRPDVKTDRFKNVFVNRLIFRYSLWSFFYLYTTKDCKGPQTNMPENVESIKTWSYVFLDSQLTYTQMWSKMQILEGYAEFESFCLHCAGLWISHRGNLASYLGCLVGNE